MISRFRSAIFRLLGLGESYRTEKIRCLSCDVENKNLELALNWFFRTWCKKMV